ncbi:Threonine aldolase [Coemansia sp. RSA 1836]|nr:Threonine aldolase [Coemansia sp. RSA 1836]
MPATHERARRLARGLESVGFVLALPVHTNMVLLDSTKEVGVSATELAQTLKPKGIILGAVYEGTMLRIVLHHQIDDECVETILATARELSSDRH